jgi:hypothetical protein
VITFKDEEGEWQVTESFTMNADWDDVSKKIDNLLIDNNQN